jgi:hypothetical protein
VAKLSITLLAALARLDLPLPGRRAGADGGGACLRGPARPLWHPLLAGLQGARRMPHADALAARARHHAGFSTGRSWLPVPEDARAPPSTCRKRSRTRCSTTTAQRWRSGRRIRPLHDGDMTFVDTPTRTFLAFTAKRTASGCFSSSTSPAKRRISPCRCRCGTACRCPCRALRPRWTAEWSSFRRWMRSAGGFEQCLATPRVDPRRSQALPVSRTIVVCSKDATLSLNSGASLPDPHAAGRRARLV